MLNTMRWANGVWAMPADRQAAKAEFESASDGELVHLTINGQSDAYAELVRRYQVSVYNIALRLVGNRQDALELSQDAFVRAYSALRSFDRARPFGPWVNRIVTNLALNWLQKRTPASLSIDAEDNTGMAELQLPDETANPERLVLASEHREQIRQALVSLPPDFRVVVELRHFQDFSYDEIAATLDIPLSDVKSRLFRARRHLRRWLESNP